jgi:hypothetical protein
VVDRASRVRATWARPKLRVAVSTPRDDGAIAGAIGASGGSVEQDMACAQAALDELAKL